MCLIAFHWQPGAEVPLVLAANRDEFHERPTRALNWWQWPDGILAGRDEAGGGTWMGVRRDGRFAAVTN
ncbi:MAG: NRDE family protein, partial [Wenzhouxiangellaceae bacterium]